MGRDIFISVVIPVYNEEKRIAGSVEKIARFFAAKDYDWELICVLDGCEDGSRRVINDLCSVEKKRAERFTFSIIENEDNHGKGHSVCQGVLASKGRYVLFTDADLSTPIEEVDRLLESLERDCDVAIGSRGLDKSSVVVKQNIVRRVMGRTFNLCVRLFTGLRFYDTQCGFKCFERKAGREIFHRLKVKDFCFDVEVLYLAELLGFRVKELPVRWTNSPESKVNMCSDSFQMLVSLLRIRAYPKSAHTNGK
jgi:dolichyl-phosphate beta-glucosyltransferase